MQTTFQIWRKWQQFIQTGRKTLCEKEKLLVRSNFSFSHSVFKRLVSQGRQKVSLCGTGLKMALQILEGKYYKNTKKSSLYSQSHLVFIHNTPVVESHPKTREIRDLLWPRSTPTGNTIFFYISSSLIYALKIHRQSFKHSVRWRCYGK